MSISRLGICSFCNVLVIINENETTLLGPDYILDASAYCTCAYIAFSNKNTSQ